MSKKLSIVTLMIGVIGMWLFIDHISNFTYPDYFYNANPDITYYVGINVVSMIADLSFFTYHTLIFFSLWCIGLGISSLFKISKIYNFCIHISVVVFIFTNYIITTFLYTIFELTSGNITFGLYAYDKYAIHNFGTNIIAHYILFIYNLFLFIKIKPINKIERRHYIYMLIYLVIYLLYVKISGMYFYNIEWYPYPIFDLKSLLGIFNISVDINIVIEYIILLILLAILTYLYYSLLKLVNKIKKDI